SLPPSPICILDSPVMRYSRNLRDMNIRRREFLKKLSFVVGTAAVPSFRDIPSAGQEEDVKTGRGRSVMWAPEKGLGLDHVALEYQDQGIFADGVVIGFDN